MARKVISDESELKFKVTKIINLKVPSKSQERSFFISTGYFMEQSYPAMQDKAIKAFFLISSTCIVYILSRILPDKI